MNELVDLEEITSLRKRINNAYRIHWASEKLLNVYQTEGRF